MVIRLALRRGGPFTLTEVIELSPLNDEQAQEALNRMVESGRLSYEDATYRLLPHG
jgi:DNA-binding IclR family transcriptional regulator